MTTLAELAPDEIVDPGPSPTFLIRRCAALMVKPLDQFTVEDLRIMLSQAICVRHLLPLAVRILVQDPLAEGDMYPGDLLAAVAGLPTAVWSAVPEQHRELVGRLRSVSVEDPYVIRAIASLVGPP